MAYKYLLLILGLFQIILAIIELLFPQRIFSIWKKFILSRFYPGYGIILILIGLPLTAYKGYLSLVILFIALFIVFSGAFILFYPEKIRRSFNESEEIFNNKTIKLLIYFEALLRICAGAVFLIACWKTFFII
jgi:hypothetical protein